MGHRRTTLGPTYNGNVSPAEGQATSEDTVDKGKATQHQRHDFFFPSSHHQKSQELQWNQRHKQGNSCSKKPLKQLPRTRVAETSAHLKIGCLHCAKAEREGLRMAPTASPLIPFPNFTKQKQTATTAAQTLRQITSCYLRDLKLLTFCQFKA